MAGLVLRFKGRVNVCNQIGWLSSFRIVKINLKTRRRREDAAASREPLTQELRVGSAKILVRTEMRRDGIITAGDCLHTDIVVRLKIGIDRDTRVIADFVWWTDLRIVVGD